MKRTLINSNQKGITLIEVLVSISILTIILITLMNIFPQMGLFNQKNEARSQGVNTAKEIVVEWQNKETIKNSLTNPVSPMPEGLVLNGEYYEVEQFVNEEKVEIKIAKVSDMGNSQLGVHQIHVRIKDKNDSVIGESFGYITVGD